MEELRKTLEKRLKDAELLAEVLHVKFVQAQKLRRDEGMQVGSLIVLETLYLISLMGSERFL